MTSRYASARWLRERAVLPVAALALAVALGACSDRASGVTPSPQVTAPPSAAPATPSPTPTALAFGAVSNADPARVLDHVRALAETIGPRPAGTEAEAQAAAYIRDQLEAAGYEVTYETFPVEVPRDESRVGIPGGSPFSALALTGSIEGEITGRVVSAGLGRAEDFAEADARGAIVLVERGRVSFSEKVDNAQRAGAVAVIVANNEAGLFRGTLADLDVFVPVVGVTAEDAGRLDEAIAAGTRVTVMVERTDEPFESLNVVGRPSDAPCTAYLGAHYDSVPLAPGGNDNASGTAMMLELARTHRAPGLCVAAFGAEEVGLFGSKALVKAHDMSDVRFMLNFDMVGKRTRPEFIASANDPASDALADRAAAIAAGAGVAMPRGRFPAFASSDHASFSQAGVPAITVHSGDDDQIHQPGDTLDNVRPEDVREMLRVSQLLVRDLLAEEQG